MRAILKWAFLLIRIFPLLEDLYEHVIAIIAVVNTERKTWDELDDNTRHAQKRLDAVEFLKKFSLFASKNQSTLNNIVNSAYNFVFHKEK